MRWDKLFQGVASGIPVGIDVATGIEDVKASKERRQRERDKLLDDLKTAAQNREIAAAEEGRAVEMHPLQLETERSVAAQNNAYAGSATANAEATRARAAREAEEARRAKAERESAARLRRSTGALSVGSADPMPDNRRPNVAPAVVPYADPEKYTGRLADTLRTARDEEFERVTDPNRALAFQEHRNALLDAINDPNANPQEVEALRTQLGRRLEQEFDLLAAGAINAVTDGNQEAVQRYINQMGLLHPNQNMALVGRLSEDGESVEVGVVNRGTDADDFQGYKYPLSQLPEVLRSYGDMMYRDMTLTESEAADASTAASATKSALELEKLGAEVDNATSGGGLSPSVQQSEWKMVEDYLEGPGAQLLAEADIDPVTARRDVMAIVRKAAQQGGLSPGAAAELVEGATWRYIATRNPNWYMQSLGNQALGE